MEYRKLDIKDKPAKKAAKKSTKPKKGSPEAIFKAFDELHKAGFDLSYLKP